MLANRERKRKESIQREAEASVRLEEERRRQLALEQEQDEARLRTLLAEVKRWRDSQEIRAYLDEIRRVTAARGEVIQPGSKLDQWMNWAGSVAQRLDPLQPRNSPAGPTS